jgi:hypothetical protein
VGEGSAVKVITEEGEIYGVGGKNRKENGERKRKRKKRGAIVYRSVTNSMVCRDVQ